MSVSELYNDLYGEEALMEKTAEANEEEAYGRFIAIGFNDELEKCGAGGILSRIGSRVAKDGLRKTVGHGLRRFSTTGVGKTVHKIGRKTSGLVGKGDMSTARTMAVGGTVVGGAGLYGLNKLRG